MNLDHIFCNEQEQPLDSLLTNGGYTAIFRTIACVGDSLSSGEFESSKSDGTSGYHDFYEYSWGQFLGRMCGSRVYNFSRGGMTAQCYWESFADENGFWDPKYAAQCYIIALGVNDLTWAEIPLGSMDDVDPAHPENNKNTFAGYYGRILSRLKTIQPRARFFLMTMPRSDDADFAPKAAAHRELMVQMAHRFENAYLLDLHTYAPVYDAAFREKFYMRGHMNPMGYLLTAQMVSSYIDYIIRHRMNDFKDVGFIGTDLHA